MFTFLLKLEYLFGVGMIIRTFLTGLTIKNSLLDLMSFFILFSFFSQWFINNYFTSLKIVGKFYSLVVSNDGLIPIPNSWDSLQKS